MSDKTISTDSRRYPKVRGQRFYWYLAIAIGTYVILFVVTVNQGRAMYGIDDGVIQRGSVTYYWFSRRPAMNQTAGTFFSPILTWVLRCRPYSSFAGEGEYIEWCEAGNDVFIDSVDEIP